MGFGFGEGLPIIPTMWLAPRSDDVMASSTAHMLPLRKLGAALSVFLHSNSPCLTSMILCFKWTVVCKKGAAKALSSSPARMCLIDSRNNPSLLRSDLQVDGLQMDQSPGVFPGPLVHVLL